MFVKIFMGNNLLYSIKPKRIDVSTDGILIKIIDTEGNIFETSPNNVVIISKEGEVK